MGALLIEEYHEQDRQKLMAKRKEQMDEGIGTSSVNKTTNLSELFFPNSIQVNVGICPGGTFGGRSKFEHGRCSTD
jgi:hypothetical protein